MSYVDVSQYESTSNRRIYGTIVDANGRGLFGALVNFCGTAVITDTSGNFQIPNPAYSSCYFTVNMFGYDLLSTALTAPGNGEALYVHVVMTATFIPPGSCQVEVRAVDYSTGQPISQATVEFTDGTISYKKTTDSNGYALFTELPPSTAFIFRVYRTGYESWESSYTTPSSGSYDLQIINLNPVTYPSVIFDWTAPSDPKATYPLTIHNVGCHPTLGCTVVVDYYVTRIGECRYANSTPYVYCYINGFLAGLIPGDGSSLQINPFSGDNVKLITSAQPIQRKVVMGVKNTGQVDYNFAAGVQVVPSASGTGCGLSGNTTYQPASQNVAIPVGQTVMVDFPIPNQYAAGYAIGKVYAGSSCLDGGVASF